jgi:ubiquinone/menaquinone biosynthesis C-methylase UbiE
VTDDAELWQLEGDSAELYERHLVPALTLPWAIDLVERAEVRPGDRVLDVACGTGAVARIAAARVGTGGRVVGLDLNRDMLAIARSRRPAPDERSIEWREGSALALPFSPGEFRVVLCQLGLQFFPDRLEALREMHRVLEPGGCVGVSVYSEIERQPAAAALSAALDRHLGESASLAKRREHSLADVEGLRTLLVDAGFVDASIQTVARTARFASVAQWVRLQFVATPLASLLTETEPSERERLVGLVSDDVAARLAPFVHADGLAFPQELHVAVAAV